MSVVLIEIPVLTSPGCDRPGLSDTAAPARKHAEFFATIPLQS